MKLSQLLLLLVTAGLISLACGAKRKYAPSYCLRLKFNCANAEKRRHVCCMFPLPVSQSPPEAELNADDGVGVKRIRPLRLPSRTSSSGDGDANGSESNSKDGQRYDVFNQKKRKAKDPKAKKAAVSRDKPDVEGQQPPVVNIGKKLPRICQRLVVNCRSSPSHRCCVTPTLSPVSGNDLVTLPPLPVEVLPVELLSAEEEVQHLKVEVSSLSGKRPSTTLASGHAVATVETVPLDRHAALIAAGSPNAYQRGGEELNLNQPQKVTEEPYERIPAECFTMVFDCQTSPGHMCCPYHRQ